MGKQLAPGVLLGYLHTDSGEDSLRGEVLPATGLGLACGLPICHGFISLHIPFTGIHKPL